MRGGPPSLKRTWPGCGNRCATAHTSLTPGSTGQHAKKHLATSPLLLETIYTQSMWALHPTKFTQFCRDLYDYVPHHKVLPDKSRQTSLLGAYSVGADAKVVQVKLLTCFASIDEECWSIRSIARHASRSTAPWRSSKRTSTMPATAASPCSVAITPASQCQVLDRPTPIPPLQAEGPRPQPQRLGEDTEVDTDLHMSFMEILLDAEDVDDAVRMILEKPETSPVSWTTWTSTMDFFIETLEEADVQRWDAPRQMGSGRAASARAR